MAKNIRRETTVTYRCDGCGHEEFKIDEYVLEDILPDGWGTILYVEGSDPHVQANANGGHQYLATSIVPMRKIICCHLCSKKLADFFKNKDVVKAEEPIKAVKPWWARLFW